MPKFRFSGLWLSGAAFLYDLFAVALAWLIAYLLRFEGHVPADFVRVGLWTLTAVVPIYGAMFWLFGLYRGLWLFASLPDLIRMFKAIGVGAALTIALTVVTHPSPSVPRTVLFIVPILVLCIMGGARAGYRAAKEFHRYGGLLAQGKPILLIGAGQAAASLVRELSRSAEWRLVGLLDDDPVKQGREIYGYDILGPIAELPKWAQRLKVEHVIIAMPSATLEAQKAVVELCVNNHLQALILPALAQLDEGQPFLPRVRGIDLEDLLGREAVEIDSVHVGELLAAQTVLVTGAGGSIGSELCRQIARFNPKNLVVVEQSEFSLYRLLEEFSTSNRQLAVTPLAGDVKDPVFLQHVFSIYRPSIVFHAAAYKHVPLMEQLNPWQAVRNNVLGTYQLALATANNDVRRFVLVSTDKAVNPTNVMGATKRLAEMVCQSLQQQFPGTAFETVRFGNVLGSDGSVVPKFQEQIARGGPVTVTHPEITRYFMTIPEAAQLVLQASSMGNGGEIYILDMGQPVKIVDLARNLIRLNGFTEDQVKIEFTGLRPGEKLYEELLADDETTRPTPHAKLRIAKARDVGAGWVSELLPWLLQARVPTDEEVRENLRTWVVEYLPSADSSHISEPTATSAAALQP